MRSRIITFLVASSLLVGCGGGGGGSSEGGGACSALNAKVFNGEVCDQSARSPVVALFPIASNGSQVGIAGICTGSLVTVDDILTSAHCFVEPIRSQGSAIVGFAAVVGGSNGEARRITNVAIHPNYDGSVASPFDVAMATLESPPSPPIGPVPVLLSQVTKVGQRASTFGYGTDNQGEVGTLKSAELTIDGFAGGNIITTMESSGASICQGDSGGPLIQVINGVSSIVGVNSFGSGNPAQCAAVGSGYSGFVDLQNLSILEFISNYAPDVAAN